MLSGRDIFSLNDWKKINQSCLEAVIVNETQTALLSALTDAIKSYHQVEKTQLDHLSARCERLQEIIKLCRKIKKALLVSQSCPASPATTHSITSSTSTPTPLLHSPRFAQSSSLTATTSFSAPSTPQAPPRLARPGRRRGNSKSLESECRSGNLDFFIHVLQQLACDKSLYLQNLEGWFKRAKTHWVDREAMLGQLSHRSVYQSSTRLKLFGGSYLEKIDPAHRNFEFNFLDINAKNDSIRLSLSQPSSPVLTRVHIEDKVNSDKIKRKSKFSISKIWRASKGRNDKEKDVERETSSDSQLSFSPEICRAIERANEKMSQSSLLPDDSAAVNHAFCDWLKSESALPFFLWLENHPVLTDAMNQAKIANVSYALEDLLKVEFDNSFLYARPVRGDEAGDLLTTAGVKNFHPKMKTPPHSIAFVWTKEGDFLTHPHKVGEWHHGSLSAGHSVRSAGMWTVVKGKVTDITNNSGHYRPDSCNFYLLIKHLLEQGVLASDVRIQDHHCKDHKDNPEMTLEAYLDWATPQFSEANDDSTTRPRI